MQPFPRTFASHVDLPQADRHELITCLNRELAASMDLYTQVKQAHWNIRGPQFYARHELFDRIAGKLTGFADNFAERAGALGGYAMGTARAISQQSYLPEYNLEAVDGRHHIQVLVERYAMFTSSLREAVKLAQHKGDPATEDLMIEVLRQVEIDLWFLESHINV